MIQIDRELASECIVPVHLGLILPCSPAMYLEKTPRGKAKEKSIQARTDLSSFPNFMCIIMSINAVSGLISSTLNFGFKMWLFYNKKDRPKRFRSWGNSFPMIWNMIAASERFCRTAILTTITNETTF